ncbi:MAG TPA: hypothetical protein DIC18_00845 [Clostridiales bacterium]|nr:hypothetical protein [Clostridiales bacterium]HCU55863.1 hypothetical protein [Clostridiales bacterium]
MSRNEKIAAYLGFSVKSRKIVYGYESVIATGKRLYLVLCDNELAENSFKKVMRYAEIKQIPVRKMASLSDYFGGKAIKCVGLAEENLASAVVKELNKQSEVGTDE